MSFSAIFSLFPLNFDDYVEILKFTLSVHLDLQAVHHGSPTSAALITSSSRCRAGGTQLQFIQMLEGNKNPKVWGPGACGAIGLVYWRRFQF